MTKQRYRKIPVGWRILTPTERVRDGDYMNAKFNYSDAWIEFQHGEYVQSRRAKGEMTGGFIPAVFERDRPADRPNFIFIRRKSQSETLTVTSSLDTTVGTQAANGVESAAIL